MFERFANKKVIEILLKICYLPFVLVGGVTVSFYDVAQMERHSLVVYLLVVGSLHTALWVFWAFIFKRVLAEALRQMSFSKLAVNAGLLIAYVAGLFIGWFVHRYA
jgi:hypothetical protein